MCYLVLDLVIRVVIYLLLSHTLMALIPFRMKWLVQRSQLRRIRSLRSLRNALVCVVRHSDRCYRRGHGGILHR